MACAVSPSTSPNSRRTTLELYVERQSRLHRLDPRTKLAFTLAGAVMLVVTSNLFLILGWLALAHVLLVGAGIPFRKILWAWRLMLPLLVLVPPSVSYTHLRAH